MAQGLEGWGRMGADDFRYAAHADIAQLISRAWRLRHEDTRQARGAAARALDLARVRADAVGAAWAALRLAVCEHILALDQDTELAQLQACVDSMRALRDDAGEAEALNLLGIALSNRGSHEASLQAHRQCCALRQAAGDADGVAGSLGNQATPLRALGRWEEARVVGLDSLRLAQQVGEVRMSAYARAGLGLTELLAGNAVAAIVHLELAFAAAARTEDRALECTALTRLAQARVQLGALDQARELLGHAQAMALRTGNVRDGGRVCLVWGLLERAAGDVDRADAHFAAALHEARRGHDRLLEREVDEARAASPA